MNKQKFFKCVFFFGALWNFVMGGPLFIKSLFGDSPFSGAALMYFQGFLCAVILFGIGYLIVGLDLNKNHAIVLLGAIGKIMVFIFFVVYYLKGQIKLYLVLVGTGDLIFAILFFMFLLQYQSARKNTQA